MNSFERSHSFLVRIWQEPCECSDAAPLCRGVVQHVTTGKQRYFTTLDELRVFISEYLSCLHMFDAMRPESFRASWWSKLTHFWHR